MRTRRLPITDLARICVQPADLQKPALKQVKGSGQGANYNPTRGQFAGIVNRKPGVFESSRDSWDQIKKSIVAACRSPEEWALNEPVAKQLYDYCDRESVRATELDGYPISFSVGPKIVCWAPALLVYEDRITVPFLDFRRTRNLHREAMRCIFSLMHHALRVNNPDYSDVRFEIFKFRKDKQRTLIAHPEADMWLYSYDELEAMIAITQRLWFDVLSEREEEVRRKGSGTIGPLI